MKKNHLPGLFGFALFMPVMLHAQQTTTVCDQPAATAIIQANNIRAGVRNGGDLFGGPGDLRFTPNPTPDGPNPATIGFAGIWIGGFDPAFNLKVAALKRSSGDYSDYSSGPLDANGTTEVNTCQNWDKIFRVRGSDVKAFLDDLPNFMDNPSAAIANYKDIMGWPARGNLYFANIWGFDLPYTQQGLASFHDENFDGKYDPLEGDYPAIISQSGLEIVPEEILWCVFNDEGGGAVHNVSNGTPLQIEVQLTVWAFKDLDQPVLNNTLFTQHRVINRGTDRLDSCYVGMWVDFDIGCYTDDYFGSIPDLDAFFAYNQDAVDGSTGSSCTGGVATFGDHPPVQSVTFLSGSLDKFIYYNNKAVGNPLSGTTDPVLPLEYYRYLTGAWRNSLPLTYGGSGYNPGNSLSVDHAFPDAPSDVNGWSMCTANLPYYDRLVLGIHKFENILPGYVNDLVAAWTVHPNPDLPCGLGTVLDDIENLHDLYAEGFINVSSPLTGIPEILQAEIEVFPNPATEMVTLVYGDLPVREIRLFAADGRVVRSLQNLQPEQTVLNTTGLTSGIYTVQLLTERGIAVKKISVLK